MDKKINLCASCKFGISTCAANYEDLSFGNGWGNDNVCGCKVYKPKETENKSK